MSHALLTITNLFQGASCWARRAALGMLGHAGRPGACCAAGRWRRGEVGILSLRAL